MALVVYDQGYRIQTPVSSQFKPKGVDPLTESKRSAAIPTSEDIPRDEAEELAQSFTLPNASEERSAPQHRRLPAATDNTRTPNTYGKKAFAGHERRKSGLTAKQLFVSPVFTARTHETLYTAYERMKAHGIHHLVIVDDDSRPLGLISAADIDEDSRDSARTIATVYHSQIIVASLDTELSLLAATFVNYPVRALPVIDDEEKVLGIITRSDLLRLLINNARVESWA
ncbi:CBS domain-containing protein [Marinobacterium sp. YM272]|uniref:CBS domain-containing protein n=1 Tax=Marinobacterium sp. YM272 TaxID=3421654 RepID=UPI003D7F7E01